MNQILTSSDILRAITDGLKGRKEWPEPGNAAILLKMQEDPKRFITDVLDVKQLWSGQEEIIEKIRANSRVAIASGHALGKDFISARLMLWFLYSYIPSIVIATSASYRQISKIVWGEVAESFHGAKYALRGRLTANQIIVDDRRKWYALGFATKDVHGMPGKFQGFHQKNVMVLFSEAQAVEPGIWDEAESLMASGNVKMIAIGNPIVNFGRFADCWRSDSNWVTINLDCEKSPNYLSGEEIIPGLCSREWVEMMAKKYGKDSPIYIARVKGLLPPSVEGVITDRASLDWATTTGLVEIKAEGDKIAGVDPAAQGTNKTVVALRHGMNVVALEKYGSQSTMTTAGRIVQILNSGVTKVYLDVTGIGTGIYDRLVELGHSSHVIPVAFGGRAREYIDMKNPAIKESEKYANASTQMYYNLGQLLEKRRIAMPYDPDAALQLLNRRIRTRSDGKLEIESKDEYIERGFDSPDEADALALCFCGFLPPGGMPKPFVQILEDEEIDDIFRR